MFVTLQKSGLLFLDLTDFWGKNYSKLQSKLFSITMHKFMMIIWL